MGEKLNGRPRNKEELDLYNGAQLLLIKYMMHRGVIKSFEEYVEKYAEIFEMLSEGVLETCSDARELEIIEEMREDLKKITNNT